VALAIVSTCLVMLAVLVLDLAAGRRMVNDISLRRAASGVHLNVDASGYSRCITRSACSAFSALLLHLAVGWSEVTIIDLVVPALVIWFISFFKRLGLTGGINWPGRVGGLGFGIRCRRIGSSLISLGIASSAILRDCLSNRV
jgi:hypothetical protein